MTRAKLALRFLEGTDWTGIEPAFLTGDASARRYYRLPGAVLMDAPPGDGQSVAPFVRMTQHLRQAGLNAPRIFAEDPTRGFLLLEDFGDDTFARVIERNPAQELPLYLSLVPILVALEDLPFADLPRYMPEQMAQMTEPGFTWYRWAVTGDASGLDSVAGPLSAALLTCTGQAVSLRDFHAENVMWLPERTGLSRVGLLDYQDAMIGPRGYDLASLLLDARRGVSSDVIETVQAEYATQTHQSLSDVQRSFAILGLQRNLRILGIFTRLALKLGKPRYLDFLPRVWRYVRDCAAQPGLEDLAEAIRQTIPQPDAAMIEGFRTRCGTLPNRP